jgi:hypothetical protein
MISRWSLLASGCLAAVVYCFGFGTAGAQVANLDAIFVQQDGGEIDNLNTTTGASTLLYTATGLNWNGAAYDSQNGLVYIDDIGESGFEANQIITNTIYSFNPETPSAGVTEIGTISGQDAFTGAGFHDGLYYAIGSGSDDLVAYNLSSVTGGVISQVSSQALGGLGTGITGLSLGDLDFVGNTIYVSAGTVTSTASGATVSTDYTLYKYTNVNNTSTAGLAYSTSEGTTNVGVGIGYDFNSGKLVMFNTNINNEARRRSSTTLPAQLAPGAAREISPSFRNQKPMLSGQWRLSSRSSSLTGSCSFG